MSTISTNFIFYGILEDSLEYGKTGKVGNIFMAEYHILYEELEALLNEYIAASPDNVQLSKHKAEILAALTGNYEQQNPESTQEMIALWENQIEKPSELLLGSRYIRVQQIMLDFLKIACASGLIDAVILYASQGNLSGFTISVGSNIAIILWELFTTVKKLDDWDFCVYKQAVSHYREYNGFTIEELTSWFPNEAQPVCNMHTRNWDCDYLKEDDTCSIIQKQKIEQALNSLYNKGLLSFNKENHKYVYKFKK